MNFCVLRHFYTFQSQALLYMTSLLYTSLRDQNGRNEGGKLTGRFKIDRLRELVQKMSDILREGRDTKITGQRLNRMGRPE